jgi:hypothetical protein
MVDSSPDVVKVYKDSVGDFCCNICKRNYVKYDEAMVCWRSHQPEVAEDTKDLVVSINTAKAVKSYETSFKNNDIMSAGQKLMLSMLEDYHLVRENEFMKNGRPGVMTLNFSKAASEAMMAMMKMVYGERRTGISVSIDGNKPDDLSALKDFIKRGNQDSSIDVSSLPDWKEGDPLPYSAKFKKVVKDISNKEG